ncbi:hypothetical protein [Inediibacterium massiliense]|uniref:hypothetical protein n=1 Tax=Inediibacterium massiliense TaxID=1658111 RepID=UPI0006B4887C|nr:hypothetical protein [Inediibacterium massiliense]
MSKFVFKMDEEAEEFCMLIASEMRKLFGITEEEAIGRINRFWSNLGTFEGEDMLIYHETGEFWAKEICYGHDSKWWAKEGKEDIKPIPFP